MSDTNRKVDRRRFLTDGVRATGAIALGCGAGFLIGREGTSEESVWQIDPDVCVTCGNCATYCVLDLSAVKAVQCYELCAMCDLCTGYFDTDYLAENTAAENQMCPTGAIQRELVKEEAGVGRFEYPINEELCIGCGKCVEGCAMMNGSMYLQVRHDRCLNCNDCSIATACPSQAFQRVSAEDPYLMKKKAREILRRKGQDNA